MHRFIYETLTLAISRRLIVFILSASSAAA